MDIKGCLMDRSELDDEEEQEAPTWNVILKQETFDVKHCEVVMLIKSCVIDDVTRSAG